MYRCISCMYRCLSVCMYNNSPFRNRKKIKKEYFPISYFTCTETSSTYRLKKWTRFIFQKTTSSVYVSVILSCTVPLLSFIAASLWFPATTITILVRMAMYCVFETFLEMPSSPGALYPFYQWMSFGSTFVNVCWCTPDPFWNICVGEIADSVRSST